MNAIFIKTEYGVIVELRQWGQDKSKWLDNYALEWQQLPHNAWESRGHHMYSRHGGVQRVHQNISAQEIGRWSGSLDIYETVKLANNVQLSDGRKVCVEAEHNGEVKVTLIQGPRPEGAVGWGHLSPRIISEEMWEREQAKKKVP